MNSNCKQTKTSELSLKSLSSLTFEFINKSFCDPFYLFYLLIASKITQQFNKKFLIVRSTTTKLIFIAIMNI